jgi:hypothetical protein
MRVEQLELKGNCDSIRVAVGRFESFGGAIFVVCITSDERTARQNIPHRSYSSHEMWMNLCGLDSCIDGGILRTIRIVVVSIVSSLLCGPLSSMSLPPYAS